MSANGTPTTGAPRPDPAVTGSIRTVPGCKHPPRHPDKQFTLDELLHWPADKLAELTCGDLERALPGAKAPTLSAFASQLTPAQRDVYSTGIISADVKLSSNSLVDDFKAGVDAIGSNIGAALGLGGLLTGILTVVLTGVFVLGGLALVFMGLNRATGGGLGRAASTAAPVVATAAA